MKAVVWRWRAAWRGSQASTLSGVCAFHTDYMSLQMCDVAILYEKWHLLPSSLHTFTTLSDYWSFPIQPKFPIQCKSGFCFVDGSDGGKWPKSHRWVHKWVVHLSNLIVIMNIHLIMHFWIYTLLASGFLWPKKLMKCIDWCWIELGHFPHGCKYPIK